FSMRPSWSSALMPQQGRVSRPARSKSTRVYSDIGISLSIAWYRISPRAVGQAEPPVLQQTRYSDTNEPPRDFLRPWESDERRASEPVHGGVAQNRRRNLEAQGHSLDLRPL